jgi:hypothetical protein
MKLLRIALALLLGAAIVLQFIPYGRDHANPPVTAEPNWDSPTTRELAQRACFDCHSHETVWPWYSSIAPISWWIQNHVDEGRQVLNFSTWDHPQHEADEAWEAVQEGEMPPTYYTLIHPEARLSAEETSALINGLRQSLR